MAKGGAAGGGLAAWLGAESEVFVATQRVAAHAMFSEASRALAGGILRLAREDPGLGALFKDAGHYAGATWSLALHREGGLTLPRLKAMCAPSNILSPGRARALLQLMQHLGYMTCEPTVGGAAVYAPTPAFLGAWDRHLLVALEAGARIEPELAPLLAPEAREARAAYGRFHAVGLHGSTGGTSPLAKFLRVFLHPHGGAQIVWALVAAPSDEPFPPRMAGPVSVSGLARLCRVSRIQVARVLRAAEDEGLIRLGPDGMVTFDDEARSHLSIYYGYQLAQILAAAARVLTGGDTA